ncbi:MAG: amidohydrolase family protein [Treponema sp.]|nr:amidohydrolase family protein [Treponema sp.]
MKIDFHVHITPPDIISDLKKYARNEPYFSMLSRSKVNKFASAEDVIIALEKNNFDRAVVFGFAFRDIGLCRYVNDYVIEKTKQYPCKLTGFAVTPPVKDAYKEIERCYNAGLKGVGELFPEGQGIDLENKSSSKTITRACAEFNIPLLLHANEGVGHSYPGKTKTTLKQIQAFVMSNPDLKIILAHLGGGLLFYESMKEIKIGFKNVYYDISAAPFLYDYRVYNVIKALGIADKILFASDFPMLSPSRYLNDINKSDLPENEKKLILGDNAEKLLNIKMMSFQNSD